VKYTANERENTLTANVALSLRDAPGKILVRFRHSANAPIQSVTVNGRPHSAFDAARGDVDITGMTGEVEVVAKY
jgi:hypothetical protein